MSDPTTTPDPNAPPPAPAPAEPPPAPPPPPPPALHALATDCETKSDAYTAAKTKAAASAKQASDDEAARVQAHSDLRAAIAAVQNAASHEDPDPNG